MGGSNGREKSKRKQATVEEEPNTANSSRLLGNIIMAQLDFVSSRFSAEEDNTFARGDIHLLEINRWEKVLEHRLDETGLRFSG
jgi:hypothetical protein